MAVPTLTGRALNRALLARQLLLDRADVPIPTALDRLCGIQNQYAPNAYIRLWSCVSSFRRDDLTRAYEDGSVVQGTLMRGTIHAVSAADYWPMRAVVAPAQAAWADRQHRTAGPVDRAPHVERVRAALATGPMRRPELVRLMADAPASVQLSIDTDAAIVRAPPSGTWRRRRADLCALADTVIGPDSWTAEQGLRHVVRRYLAAFGPAGTADIASFLGLRVGPVAAAAAELTLRRYRDEAGAELLDVPDGELPDPGTPAPVRFLPTWDAILLVHARRTGVLPEAHRPRIFHTKMPPSYPTFLVDGRVAGTWKHVDGRIEIAPFGDLSTRNRRALEAEAEGLAALHEV